MTTIISLAARDFIAVGCDSLATYSRPLLNPAMLQQIFFDGTGKLKTGPDGSPVLKEIDQIWQMAEGHSVNQLPSVTKLFSLFPKRAALLFAGATRIGDVSVKNLVARLQEKIHANNDSTIIAIANRIKELWLETYANEIPNERDRPGMEVLLSGYSDGDREPHVYRLNFNYDWQTNQFESEITEEVSAGSYKIAFGGQYDVIQRVVNGLDINSWSSLKNKAWQLLQNYRLQVQQQIAATGSPLVLQDIDITDPGNDLFHGDFGGVTRIFSDIGSFSEQAGIDFVEFLIGTMIKAQEFSPSIPTVGGDVHIGIIDASTGFRWISREEYRLKDHSTPKFDHA